MIRKIIDISEKSVEIMINHYSKKNNIKSFFEEWFPAEFTISHLSVMDSIIFGKIEFCECIHYFQFEVKKLNDIFPKTVVWIKLDDKPFKSMNSHEKQFQKMSIKKSIPISTAITLAAISLLLLSPLPDMIFSNEDVQTVDALSLQKQSLNFSRFWPKMGFGKQG